MNELRTLRTAGALFLGALSVSAFLASNGCYSASAGAKLETDARARDQRIESLEKGIQTERDELRAEVAHARAQVTELQHVLEQATNVVTRNSADTGAQVQELQTQLGALEGQIAETRNSVEQLQHQLGELRAQLQERMDQIARRAGVDAPLNEAEIPADRTEHYASAYRNYQAGDYSKSRSLFREYLRRYPQDDQSDNAQYWVGACYLAENQPARALGELRKVLSDYPQGDAVDEALLDMADAFYKLHACTDARTTLEALIRTHRDSPLIRRARDKQREIQRTARGYCTS